MLEDPQDCFNRELRPGETLLWCGQPQQGFLLRRSDLLLLPLSLVIFALVLGLEGWIISWLWQVLQVNDRSQIGLIILAVLAFLAILGLFPLLLSIFLVAGRFWFDRQRRRKTFYGLTNQRLMICSTILKRRIRSVMLDPKTKITLVRHGNERGSLHLNVDVYVWWWLMGPPWWLPFWPDVEAYQPPFIERITDAAEVYEQIKGLTLS